MSKAAHLANGLFWALLLFISYALSRYTMLRLQTSEYVDLAASEMAEHNFSKGLTAPYQLVEWDGNQLNRFPRNGWPALKLTLSMRLLAPDRRQLDEEFVQEYNKSMQELIQSGQAPRKTSVTGTD